jgi:hypothetical protein
MFSEDISKTISKEIVSEKIFNRIKQLYLLKLWVSTVRNRNRGNANIMAIIQMDTNFNIELNALFSPPE